MSKLWSVLRNYLTFRQVTLLGALVTHGAQAQMRMPASYIPDDDVIVKPINNEVSLYQQYVASDKNEEVAETRNQIKIWSDNQVFADQYAMDSTLTDSTFFVPSAEEKWAYFKDKYLRYLRRKGEAPLKQMPKDWYKNYRASNEVDTIDQMEKRFKETSKKTFGGKALPESLQAKEVSLWKKTKFIFQPRLDQGLVIVGFKSPIAYTRAWVGVNGETEVNVQQNFEKIGLRVMFNYYAHSGKYFSLVDKKIADNLYAQFTSSKDPQHDVDEAYQDDRLMLLYAKEF